MSGRELVRERRDAEPPREPGSGRLFDWMIRLAVVVAIGSLGYFGYTRLVNPKFLQPGPMASKLVATAKPDVVWTDADMARCKARALAAAEAPETGDAVLVERTVTEGFAGMATMVECRLSTKVARFCNPTEKAAMVEMVNDYLGRIDLLKLGMGAQGAPMAILGGAFGGEIAAGRDVYNMEKDATFAVMDTYHKRVAASLRALGKHGVVTAGDFGSFTGVPAPIAEIFKDVTVSDQLCT